MDGEKPQSPEKAAALREDNPVHEALHSALEGGAPDFSRRVLGLRLRRLTLWHLRALHLLKHPLAYGAHEGRLPDQGFESLYTAALACTVKPGGPVGNKLRRRLRPGLRQKIRASRAFRRYMADPLAEFEAFRTYWDDYFSLPPMGTTKDGETMRNVSWFVLTTALRVHLGLSEAEAELCPPGRAFAEILCAREELGRHVTLVPEEEIRSRRLAGYPV